MPDAVRRVSIAILSGLFAFGGLAPSLAAQCATQWSTTGPQAELTGQGECAALWDPDGSGPQPQRLVVGGQELIGGAEPIRQRVMTWDGSRWQALGPGPGTAGRVLALTVWNGQLVAGGDFTGGGVDYIAQWDGSAWQPIGTGGFATAVHDLTVWNGKLVAATTPASPVPVSTIRTWDGVAWSGVVSPWLGPLHAMVSYQGLLVVGGELAVLQDGALGRFDGTTWLPAILADARITSLAVRPSQVIGLDPVLYVGGAFTMIGGTPASRIAATVGGATFAWSAVGSGLSSQCEALLARNTGPLNFTLVALSSGMPMQFLSTTGAWTSMNNFLLESVIHYGGSYHATRTTGAFGSGSCLRWDGTLWQPVRGSGLDGEVRSLSLEFDGTGALVAVRGSNGLAATIGTL